MAETTPPVTPPVPTPPPVEQPKAPETGFPADTPVAEMSLEQREAYWKHQAKYHETAWKKRSSDLSPDKIQELRDKARRHDELEQELMSDKDKAVADAKKTAAAEVTSTYMPRLVSAEFRAAAAGRIDAERMATILEPLDMSKFLTDNGDVDTVKVTAFVDGIAPPSAPVARPVGPSPAGLGQRPSSTTPSVASGRALYQEMYGKKK